MDKQTESKEQNKNIIHAAKVFTNALQTDRNELAEKPLFALNDHILNYFSDKIGYKGKNKIHIFSLDSGKTTFEFNEFMNRILNPVGNSFSVYPKLNKSVSYQRFGTAENSTEDYRFCFKRTSKETVRSIENDMRLTRSQENEDSLKILDFYMTFKVDLFSSNYFNRNKRLLDLESSWK